MNRIERMERLSSFTNAVFQRNCYERKERIIGGQRVMVSVWKEPTKELNEFMFKHITEYAKKDNPDEIMSNLKSDARMVMDEFNLYRKLSGIKGVS